jgi:hypothetical protein
MWAMLATQITGPEAACDDPGVEGNRRLTTLIAIVLLILLFIEGLTLLALGPLLPVHVFVGMLLLPPIALKLASVGYRFVRYYTGAVPYRTVGPPPLLLRALGPLVVLSTLALFGTGVALIVLGPGTGGLKGLHKLSFIVWVAAMAIHVLWHLERLPRAAAAEWLRRRPHGGVGKRALALGVSLALGLVLAAATIHLETPFRHHRGDRLERGR